MADAGSAMLVAPARGSAGGKDENPLRRESVEAGWRTMAVDGGADLAQAVKSFSRPLYVYYRESLRKSIYTAG
jgi:hypothetical protein